MHIEQLAQNLRAATRVKSEPAAQHSVHPTGGSLRVFEHFAWLGVYSTKIALSQPAHQPVTLTVRQPAENTKTVFEPPSRFTGFA